MKLSLVCLFVIACGAALPCAAQSGSAAVGSASSATGEPANEPNVKRTVIEDDGARIEELKVRGHTQRITVSPKVGPRRGYEIITGDGSRDLSDGAVTSRGAAGKRVWNVLTF